MTSKLEEIARALCTSYTLQFCSTWDSGAQKKHIEINWNFHISAARAAVEAMREPTEAMVHAGEDHDGFYEYSEKTWKRMISAILNEKPGGGE